MHGGGQARNNRNCGTTATAEHFDQSCSHSFPPFLVDAEMTSTIYNVFACRQTACSTDHAAAIVAADSLSRPTSTPARTFVDS